MASGKGSNAQNIINFFKGSDVNVNLIITDALCGATTVAKDNKIDHVIWCPETEEFECRMVNIFCDPEGLTLDEWIDQGSRCGWKFIDRREYSNRPMSEAELQARREHRDPQNHQTPDRGA